jgi:hypothetical protein
MRPGSVAVGEIRASAAPDAIETCGNARLEFIGPTTPTRSLVAT